MIDAREEVLSSARPSHRTRSASSSTAPAPARTVKNTKAAAVVPKSLRIERVFSDARVKPFDQLEWERRVAEITDDAGKVIFKQENVEVPKSWSLLATKVGVSKDFYGEKNTRDSGSRVC